MTEPDRLRAARGWLAPAAGVPCGCGSTTWPHVCSLSQGSLIGPLDVPAISVRRGGIVFPPPPDHPVVTVHRLTRRSPRAWRWWMWHAMIPPLDDRPAVWSRTGKARTASGAARAGRRYVIDVVGIEPEIRTRD